MIEGILDLKAFEKKLKAILAKNDSDVQSQGLLDDNAYSKISLLTSTLINETLATMGNVLIDSDIKSGIVVNIIKKFNLIFTKKTIALNADTQYICWESSFYGFICAMLFNSNDDYSREDVAKFFSDFSIENLETDFEEKRLKYFHQLI